MIDSQKKTFRDEEDADAFVDEFLDDIAAIGNSTVKRERLDHEDAGYTVALWSGMDLIAVAVVIHDASENVIAVCSEL